MLVSPSLLTFSLEFSFFTFSPHITSPSEQIASRFGGFAYRIMEEGRPRPPGRAVFPPVCQQAAVWTGAPLGEPSPRSVHARGSGIKQPAEPLLQTYPDTRRRCVCLTPPPAHTCTYSRVWTKQTHVRWLQHQGVASQAVMKLLCPLNVIYWIFWGVFVFHLYFHVSVKL